jgi:hypothetical protein
VNNAFKEGHRQMKWNVSKFLRNLYYLFKSFPGRRADFIHFSGTSLFPHKFCGTRWLENVPVLQRACDMLDFLKLYNEGTRKKPPKSDCYRVVSKILSEDKLLKAKMEFMISVSKQLELFLTAFQSDASYEKMQIAIKNIDNQFKKNSLSN